jgi:hypothetical protein
MNSSIQALQAKKIDEESVRAEVEFIADALDSLRHDGAISNDAYLDAGSIQGGLMMIANLAALGVKQSELEEHLSQIEGRAARIETAHPGLGEAIESKR